MAPTSDDGLDPEELAALSRDDTPDAGEGSALSPDELDIEDDDSVVQLDSGRYVVGTDGRPSVPEQSTDELDPAPQEAADRSVDAGPTDSGAVKEWLEDDLQGTSARYGFHVSAKSDDAVSHQQMFSDDVGTVFDSLLRWYAQQLTTDTAVEDVLGILLTESNVRVRYSPSCLQAILRAYDLGPDDSIADLVEAVREDRGMVFPPENV
ncbi:DUF7500 family protein [Halorussus marinus]|uniref:DUF7500 family protein n=1 Tax=Halorussus marinus TaxID=2505976 RepID=UPI001FD6FAA2|nr:hypothetical protein [Halorussus marinus]